MFKKIAAIAVVFAMSACAKNEQAPYQEQAEYSKRCATGQTADGPVMVCEK